MTAPRLDHDGRHWFNRETFPIELDFAFSLQDEVYFGQSFVVVRLGIFLNIDQMQGCCLILCRGKGSACLTAWAWHWRELIELNPFKTFFHANSMNQRLRWHNPQTNS